MTRFNEYGQPVGDAVSWTPAREPAAMPIEGRFVRLDPLRADHLDALFAALAPYPELWTYQAEETPQSASELATSIGGTDRLAFVIFTADGRCVGRVSYLRIQPVIGSIEVGGIIYGPTLQRTRAATEVQYLLARHAFDDLGYRRYEWKCDSLNAPSRAAALRLGFTEEGTWRNALITKGRNRDTTWYSITEAEWPTVKAALESWLADDNFDDAGHQHQSLAAWREAAR